MNSETGFSRGMGHEYANIKEMIIAKKMDRKHSTSELKICTTSPSLYSSVKPLNTLAGVGKICFSPAVPTNHKRISRTTQESRMIVLVDFETFSKGVSNFIVRFLKSRSYLRK
jgi:hypothetical protein